MESIFITFEGLDGCGKTTQARLLKEFLERKNYKIYLTREPGGTILGENIRNILLNSDISIHPWTEALLYLSSRAENSLVIKEKLKEKYIVICERYIDSTLAYQGYGRGLPINKLKKLNELVTFGLNPDVTILLDISPEKIFQRKESLDRIEKENLNFYHKVREGYLKIAKENKSRIFVISGELLIEEIHHIILKIILKKLER
ncbi:MAG: dTMP kinase [Dictyoglomus sp.]|nr:dTMP kinase [Dictyoglomus sp.]MCX7942844.1 dTMP kinase [Dictyoglomaceae bacterium]MDW8188348.1 dTMP kinase [Dictyoglomus sp.]